MVIAAHPPRPSTKPFEAKAYNNAVPAQSNTSSYKPRAAVSCKPKRSERLRLWPVTHDETTVGAFLGALGPCRRWDQELLQDCPPPPTDWRCGVVIERSGGPRLRPTGRLGPWRLGERDPTRQAPPETKGNRLRPGGLVIMLVREDRPSELEPKWRGPFWISHRTGRSSFAPKQLDGTPIIP